MVSSLGFQLTFQDFYSNQGLQKLDKVFLNFLSKYNKSLYDELLSNRQNKYTSSDFIIRLAVVLERFIYELFSIKSSQSITQSLVIASIIKDIFECRKVFVNRRANKILKESKPNLNIDSDIIRQKFEKHCGQKFSEANFSRSILFWMQDSPKYEAELLNAAIYTYWACNDPDGASYHQQGYLFKKNKITDYNNLMDDIIKKDSSIVSEEFKERDGFNLISKTPSLDYILYHTNYCIFCHERDKDSCSKGLKKQNEFTYNPNDILLHGCPLGEKISEMNFLKSNGHIIAPLGVVMIDNPMCLATGNKICNDCLKSCIYQKQEPVDVPAIESRVVKDALELPWGFEIYSLFTKWNPLKVEDYLPNDFTGYKVLIAGMGPAGYSFAHYMLQSGHTVVGVEGLKIERLDQSLIGENFQPIYDINSLRQDLSSRTIGGFGGVSEYGITVRWDKNYLTLLQILLERRSNFSLYSGVRFGSNITYDQAKELGFDHIALAMGSGSPRLLNIKDNLSRGMRMASDFLMSLQLYAAYQNSSLTNLEIRMPIVVIGGGLTSIDTATEVLAYYPKQIEKFLAMYESLVRLLSKEQVESVWSEEEAIIANEYLAHGRVLRGFNNDKKKIHQYLCGLGGVKIVYRKSLVESPAYRLNHEELKAALEQGVEFIENTELKELKYDKYSYISSGIFSSPNGDIEIKASTILVSVGTKPNIAIAQEDPNNFDLSKEGYFVSRNLAGEELTPIAGNPKSNSQLMTKLGSTSVSFLGDLHPSYSGSIVKALASSKDLSPTVNVSFKGNSPNNSLSNDQFIGQMDNLLISKVEAVNILAHHIVELVLKSPAAVNNFKPGQFYRLQNYANNAIKIEDKQLLLEGIAVTGAWVDKEKGLLSVIILDIGASSYLTKFLNIGEEVVLMGPTGTPTEVNAHEKVMLIGGGLGNAVLFSIGGALKALGAQVIYFAGYKNPVDRVMKKHIEAAADVVIWSCENDILSDTRDCDYSIKGNILEALSFYSKLDNSFLTFDKLDRIITIGSDRMMNAVTNFINTDLSSVIREDCKQVVSVNSPMQCMMKGVCAQCLQRHIDPKTKKVSYIFSCFNQDQDAKNVDFSHLSNRLSQNSTQEKMLSLWLRSVLKKQNKKDKIQQFVWCDNNENT